MQAHVSNHADVASSFWGMCREAGWFEEFDKVYLVHLSPEDATVNLVRNQVEPPKLSGPNTTRKRNWMKNEDLSICDASVLVGALFRV